MNYFNKIEKIKVYSQKMPDVFFIIRGLIIKEIKHYATVCMVEDGSIPFTDQQIDDFIRNHHDNIEEITKEIIRDCDGELDLFLDKMDDFIDIIIDYMDPIFHEIFDKVNNR